MPAAKRFVIVRESSGAPLYFKLLAMGIFWECTQTLESARQFTTRSAAVSQMQTAGKHREGWRVIPVAS